jgi:NTP pyrophosphatase (non-canonical NTP hydrolase)
MRDKLLKIFYHYGIFNQMKKLNEECYELIEAINDFIYEDKDEKLIERYDHVQEEFADVMVVLEQFKTHYELDNQKIMEIMEQKIDRQLERIEKGE